MNCKPNDLAISINTDMPANNGLIVRVIRPYTNELGWSFGNRPAWWCECATPMTWFIKKTGKVVKAYEGPVPDQNLRPILDGDLDRLGHQDVGELCLRILNEKTKVKAAVDMADSAIRTESNELIEEEATA